MSTVVIILLSVDIILCAALLITVLIYKNRALYSNSTIEYYKTQKECWHKMALKYKNDRNRNIQRRCELEIALCKWVHVTMKDYSDKQYGKGTLAELVKEDKLFVPENESE
jgi:hypothetical protein